MIPPNVYRDIPNVIDLSAYAPYAMGVLYLVAWFVRDYQFSIEREGLIDRLMSKDIKEFKAITAKEKPVAQAWGQLDDETLADLEQKRKDKILAGE